MKKIFLLFIISLLVINSVVVSSAATQVIPITMYFNGSFVSTELDPYTKEGITYVPLRVFTNLLGINQIEWNNEEKSVSIDYSGKVIKFFIDQNKVLVNGNEYIIEGQPTLVKGCTMVPLNFITDSLSCVVTWDHLTESIFIDNDNISVKTKCKGSYTTDDVLWLARIIQVEGSDTSYECKLAIANVVVNRVKSGLFQGTIHDVIFQTGQFPPAHKNGFSVMVPKDCNIYVAKQALNGENNISTCLYFNNSPFRSKADDLYKTIDGEYFYK